YSPGDLVYLSTKNLNLPKGQARKLLPKFIGPYKVLEAQNESSNVVLEILKELKARKIHATFHNKAKAFYDFGKDDEQEWFIEEIIGHEWTNDGLQFRVQWTLGDVTWEPLSGVKELEGLDRYLELCGIKRLRDLPRIGSRNKNSSKKRN
ncbi:hypothetical protein M422DRAFT_253864, partial [Sphaerobolus stellatus SS14]